jgi:hypothetical protein
MNARSWIPLITFAVGFLCAWLAKPGENPPPPTDLSAEASAKVEASEAQEPRQSRRLTALQRRSSADSRIAGLLDDGQDWQPGLDEDYPRLLMALQRRAGLSGLEGRSKWLLCRIVTSWYDANPGDALSWVVGLGNPKDEGELLSEIARNCELGDDFQFREILERHGSAFRPSGLFEEWARRDFAAAWEWSYANVSSGRQLQGMAEAWSEKVGNDEVAEFAARLMDESNWDPEVAKRRNWGREQWRVEHMHIVLEMLMNRPSPDRFQSLLERVSDRQESLNALLRCNLHLIGSPARRYREGLLNQMTADERMTAFESIDPDFIRRSNRIRENFEEVLTLLGHSAEEIDWMLPAPAPEDSTQAPESNEPAQDPFD